MPEIVLTFHCLNKLFRRSQNFCKFSAFSLEFQKFFSITRTIFFSKLVRTILVTKYQFYSIFIFLCFIISILKDKNVLHGYLTKKYHVLLWGNFPDIHSYTKVNFSALLQECIIIGVILIKVYSSRWGIVQGLVLLEIHYDQNYKW